MSVKHASSITYMPQLQALRGLSVLAVIYTHYLPENHWLFGIYWGGLGVRCFFVLSGFLITSILLRDAHATASFKALYAPFLLRRALRLYPVLLISMIVGAAFAVDGVRESFVWVILYLTNFYIAHIDGWGGAIGPLWSLAVEEQFYLLWPWVIFFCPRRVLFPLLIVLFVAAPLFRLIWISAGFSEFGSWVLPPASFDALAMGAWLALFHSNRTAVNSIGVVGCCIWSAMMFSPLGDFPVLNVAEIQISAAAMIFAWIVARASTGFGGLFGLLLDNPALQYVGTISYGVYIVHQFVPYYVVKLGIPFSGWKVKIVALVLTLTLASLSWHLIERPIARWGRALIARRQKLVSQFSYNGQTPPRGE